MKRKKPLPPSVMHTDGCTRRCSLISRVAAQIELEGVWVHSALKRRWSNTCKNEVESILVWAGTGSLSAHSRDDWGLIQTSDPWFSPCRPSCSWAPLCLQGFIHILLCVYFAHEKRDAFLSFWVRCPQVAFLWMGGCVALCGESYWVIINYVLRGKIKKID